MPQKIFLAGLAIGLVSVIALLGVVLPRSSKATDCKAVAPIFKLHNENVARFYDAAIQNRSMTSALALQLATNVEQGLSTLPRFKVRDADLKATQESLRIELKRFPTAAREWASLKPLQFGDDYLRLRSQSGRDFRLEGAREAMIIASYCRITTN